MCPTHNTGIKTHGIKAHSRCVLLTTPETGNAIVGQHGLGKMNKNGELLVEFAYKNNLKVAGTFYEKRNEKKIDLDLTK